MDISRVKRNLNKRVKLTNTKLFIENSEYVLSACIIRKGNKGFYYQAELQDIHNENSILICRLEEIEEVQE